MNDHLKQINLSHKQLAKQLKFPYSTVNLVLKNYYERLTVERSKGSSRKRQPVSAKKEQRILQLFKENLNISTRDVAKKVNMSQCYIQKAKKRAALKSFKAQIGPDRNSVQNRTAKARSRRLYDTMLTKYDCVVMDDETYCKADFKQIPGQEF